MLARHNRAAQVDRTDAVESLFGDLVERFVAAGDADPDIVVQDVDPSPARLRGGNRRGKSVFLGDVRGEGHALAALFCRHRGRLLGGVDKPVGRQDPGAFLREP